MHTIIPIRELLFELFDRYDLISAQLNTLVDRPESSIADKLFHSESIN